MFAPFARRAAAGAVVLAMLALEVRFAAGTSRIEGVVNPGLTGGRRLLQDGLMPWAMRVATCEQLREALQWEGLPRIIVMAPIACTAAEWPDPVVVSWDVEIMGASGWKRNPWRGTEHMASIEWSGVRTAVVATGGAELKIHSLVLHQDQLRLDIPEFKLTEASAVYSGLAVSASSCGDELEMYIDTVEGWERPEGVDGSQRARATGPWSLLVEDAAKYGSNLRSSTVRVCESAFECGVSDEKIQEVLRSDMVRDVCLSINVRG
ncbi:unnamed protein product [Ostreobium quekettii]|uniref:Uncharacterized protein n=1 Tax=Ostreobium quekettii TaxID=121088 RepID=A0A8S1INA7_9CHLO|nr:unnamed protein product [Ostreobium quekettii]|eukprot:evm.model.scf_1.2 EVM.evm.TU.scf_1.2   scf_1:32715-33506(-)